MRATYVSSSVTLSLQTQAMLMTVGERNYFIEYPRNLLPNPNHLKQSGNLVSEITEKGAWEVLKDCFITYDEYKPILNYLHAPSFLFAYCLTHGVNLIDLKIL